MLNSNQLKLIAVISMIIDHIGYFFVMDINSTLYVIFRSIGRIAMPLFVFLLVEGYFHTKNLRKYIFKLSIVAIITQIIMTIFEIKINGYVELLNILFSFVLTLLLLRIIDKKIIDNRKIDILIRVFFLSLIICIYLFIKIDYLLAVPLLALFFYITKKIKNKDNIYLINLICLILVPIVSTIVIYNIIGIFAMISAILIILYNGKLGKKNKIIQYIYYLVFPLQYLIMYIIKVLI